MGDNNEGTRQFAFDWGYEEKLFISLKMCMKLIIEKILRSR